MTYWRLVYFIEDNGALLNSHLQSPLDVAALTNAFNVQIAGSSQSYSELLVTTTVETVRVSELFTIVFEQKVSRRDFAAMSTSIVNAWKQVDAGGHSGHLLFACGGGSSAVECLTHNRESPGSDPLCYHFKVWAFSFSPP